MDDTLTTGWTDFAVALAGAAAALAGLVMVAISVNIREILALPGVPARAGAAVGSLVLVVVAAGLILVPGQPAPILGAELLIGVTVVTVLHVVSLRQRTHHAGAPRFSRALAVPLAGAQLLPLAVGGLLLVFSGGGLYWVAAGLLLTVIGSMLDAWVLMVEILR